MKSFFASAIWADARLAAGEIVATSPLLALVPVLAGCAAGAVPVAVTAVVDVRAATP